MKTWPALDIGFDADEAADTAGLLAALLDDFSPFAIVELPGSRSDRPAWRVFFPSDETRSSARQALAGDERWRRADVSPVDVPDESWAERSQQSLTAIRIGRVIVTPPWDREAAEAERHALSQAIDTGTAGPNRAPIVVVIEPSMGFGTGHHESTRLCLEALQGLDLEGRHVLDLGTGSGVLAITAALLGAPQVLAIDDDPDALEAASGNVALNAVADTVTTRRFDLTASPADLPAVDIVLANLTGALLRKHADRVRATVAPGGRLILSGFTADERHAMTWAFQPLELERELEENGWLALILRHPTTSS